MCLGTFQRQVPAAEAVARLRSTFSLHIAARLQRRRIENNQQSCLELRAIFRDAECRAQAAYACHSARRQQARTRQKMLSSAMKTIPACGEGTNAAVKKSSAARPTARRHAARSGRAARGRGRKRENTARNRRGMRMPEAGNRRRAERRRPEIERRR